MVAEDVLSNLLGIGSKNLGISGNFVHLRICFGHPLYEQYIASVQGIVVDVNLVFMFF
jgi:hypothetical protein